MNLREELKEFMAEIQLALEKARNGEYSLRDIAHTAWQQTKENYERDWWETYGDK